jgi:pimeloyl-ACP methyl ester carboxylesterase
VSAQPPELPGVTHRYVDAGGLRVHFGEAGEGDPLLLLHGWPQHHYMWRKVIEQLAPRYRLIAPDLRGFGWTEAPDDGYDGATLARDQIALLDALGIERASVIGHDWGGWTAFMLGLHHPERFKRLIVCNTPHPWPRIRLANAAQLPRAWYALINASPGIGSYLHRHRVMPRAILSFGRVSGRFTGEERAIFADSFRDPARARAVSRLYRYYRRAFAELLRGGFRAKRLTVPTLLLFGKRDRMISYRLAEQVAGDPADDIRVELVPDAGHFIVDEKPELIARRTEGFLR